MTDVAIGSAPARGIHAHGWSRATTATWLGHRAALLGIGLFFIAFAVVIVVPALKVNSAYGWYLAHACTPDSTGACQAHFVTVAREHTWANTVGFLLLLFPLAAGVFVGAPLIAKELESGTFRFTWTQAMGRSRFELRRLVVLGVVVIACACVLGLLMGWFIHPLETLRQNSRWDSRLFNSTVVTLPAWTLFSFTLGAFLGVAIRRTVPAMAATTIVAGALLVFAGEPAEGSRGSLTTRLIGLFPTVARSRTWIGTTFSGTSTGERFAPRGSWVVRTFTETPKGKPLRDIFGTRLWTSLVRGVKGNPTPGRLLTDHHYTFWYTYQPAARYWTFELALTGTAVILGAILVFATVRVIRRVG